MDLFVRFADHLLETKKNSKTQRNWRLKVYLSIQTR